MATDKKCEADIEAIAGNLHYWDLDDEGPEGKPMLHLMLRDARWRGYNEGCTIICG